MSYENILVDQPAEGVGRVQLNRPKALNALELADDGRADASHVGFRC